MSASETRKNLGKTLLRARMYKAFAAVAELEAKRFGGAPVDEREITDKLDEIAQIKAQLN